MTEPNQPAQTEGSDPLQTYARIFRQFPRKTSAELVAAVASDPELSGRRTVIAQAAMLASFRHAMGWIGEEQQAAEHRYLSTGCLHGEHGYCQAHTGLSGAKTPAVCKWCKAPCQCPCHRSTTLEEA